MTASAKQREWVPSKDDRPGGDVELLERAQRSYDDAELVIGEWHQLLCDRRSPRVRDGCPR